MDGKKIFSTSNIALTFIVCIICYFAYSLLNPWLKPCPTYNSETFINCFNEKHPINSSFLDAEKTLIKSGFRKFSQNQEFVFYKYDGSSFLSKMANFSIVVKIKEDDKGNLVYADVPGLTKGEM